MEDEPTVAQLIADVMTEEGHRADTVLDSRDALGRLEKRHYGLVICDLKMPHLDGPGLYRALVRLGSPLQHRILFVTGDTMSPRTLDFLKSSGLPYLAKPFLVEELKETVRQAFAAMPVGEGPAGTEWPIARDCEGKMNFTNRTVSIISADPAVAQGCIDELAALGGSYRTPVAGSIEQARQAFGRVTPAVMLLEDSAIEFLRQGETLESTVGSLAETAPVVVVAAAEKQDDLAFLITAGAVDFVARTSNFLPIVAGMLDRRARLAERASGLIQFPHDELVGDFGEILRHEVNNPLTGILGNTELLLARRDRLPPAAVERLQTIAELAVRLRETVRRLSNAWEEHHEQVHHGLKTRESRGRQGSNAAQEAETARAFAPPCPCFDLLGPEQHIFPLK